MNTKRYLLHSTKYFVKLLVLLAIICLLLFATGTARVSAEVFLQELFTAPRGWLMIGAMVLLAAAYPRFGFVSRKVKADLQADREIIIQTFLAAGYVLVRESEQEMVFRASSPVRRFIAAYDDPVTVHGEKDCIVLEGIRKETVQAQFRLDSYLAASNNTPTTKS